MAGQYTIVAHPSNPNRVLLLNEKGVTVGDTERKGRDDAAILGAFTNRTGGQTPAKALAGARTMNVLQQTGGDKKALEVIKAAQDVSKAETLSSEPAVNELLKDVYSFRQGVSKADELSNLKQTGTLGVNTGPISGRIPDFLVQLWGGVNPKEAGKRKQLSQGILNLLNPYRKEVTGAQASPMEISKYIEPALPSMKDEDTVFLDALGKYKTDTLGNIGLALDQLKRMGKDTSQFDDLIQQIEKKKPTHRFNPETGKLEAF